MDTHPTYGYFTLARNVSFLSDHPTRVGCVIVRKKPLIACSNKKCSHPKYANGSDIRGSLHAEIRAILNCRSDLNGSVAYIYRETLGGEPALSRPCVYCMEALKEAGIKKIYYTINEYPYYRWERI